MSSDPVDRILSYRVGQVVDAASAELSEGKTSPPPRYYEDSLLNDMLHAYKFAKNDQDRQMLKVTEGIGTSRTRDQMLSNLIRRELLKSKKKGKRYEIVSTPIARSMIGRLPVWLTDVATTAGWEFLLTAIEKGQVGQEEVLMQQIDYVNQIVDRAKAQMTKS